MSDPSLSRPPFIPEGTFRCCLCFDVFPIDEASFLPDGHRQDACVPCEEHDRQEVLKELHRVRQELALLQRRTKAHK